MATTGLAASGHTKYDATTPPKASSLPQEVVGKLLVNLDKEIEQARKDVDLDGLIAFQHVANYLSAAQIFLADNALLTRELRKEDIKKRLLGHWGTCPGLNLTYAHANYLISRHDSKEKGDAPKMLFVTGPGHGAPAILSCLYMEGSITRFYPQYDESAQGLEKFVRAFSFPGGFPSHVNAETPGAIHEGGELGYALGVSYGAVMDSPDVIAVAVIGDGESETGPTATAWHAHKYLDPAESGAVLPILHVNGYKIGERTIPGTMDDLELGALYTGYGYQVRFVEYGAGPSSSDADVEINVNMAASMKWAYDEIRRIQQAARSGKPITKPRWPLIILRTPKGWSGPVTAHGNAIEGSWRAHQVPLPAAAKDPEEFELLAKWLKSYQPAHLFNTKISTEASETHDASDMTRGLISDQALRIIPRNTERRMGALAETYKGYKALELSDWKQFAHEQGKEISSMKAIGSYLADAIQKNPKTFRIFSPDEITSNKLDEPLKHTHRDFQWDPETAHDGGRVIEMLSEHTLQAFMQGYTLTGRSAVFPSYEAFLGIVTTMVQQFCKLLAMALDTKWRGDIASLNYIETSTLWRQEHNGYSHQNPALIGAFIALPRHVARIYFPAEANSSVSVIAHCLRSKNYVNLVVGSKHETTTWLTPEEAERGCVAGASVWTKYSTDEGAKPDVVLVGIGVEVTHEVLAASVLLRNAGVRVRVVNVVDLMILGEEGQHPHALSHTSFDSLFTTDRPIVFNFHGYPKDLASLLFHRDLGRKRCSIHGYIEEGTTTTPWSMLRLNKASRFDVASDAILRVARQQPDHPATARAHEYDSMWKHQLRKHSEYVLKEGADPEWAASIGELKE